MVDAWRAFLGRCPWCHDLPEGPLDRFLGRWPTWLFFLYLRLDQGSVWRLGRWWHRRRHLVVGCDKSILGEDRA